MEYVEPTIYNDYEIYQDRATEKYGIRDVNTDQLVVKCVFDNIKLFPEAKLFLFSLNGREAVYKGDDIRKLAY